MNKIKNSIKILLGFLIISCAVSAQNNNAAVEKATFEIDNNVHDYGTIPENGGLASHVFNIKNTGKNPLVIKQVVASCGCTTPEWPKTPIAAGKSGDIKVSYNPQGRPGQFTKTITIYCDNADPVHLTIKGTVESKPAEKKDEKVPVFTPTETEHDFGTIGENDGYAEHIFTFKNDGEAPLTVTRVQTSCGCTKPEWTQTPVEPGKEGVIIITYNPKGRLGNFNKSATVYTNEDNGYKRHKLIIKGNVVEKPSDPFATYLDTIGGVGIEKKDLLFKNFNVAAPNKKPMYIKNFNKETAYFSWENVPEFMTVQCPDSLKADWPGELTVTIDGVKTSDRRGRITDAFDLIVKDREGKVLGSEKVKSTVNYIDDFNKLSPLQSVSAPHLDIDNTKMEFGAIKKNAKKQFVLNNTGKSDLILHSVSSDDSRVHLPELAGKVLKAGESITVKISIKAKELKYNVDTDIYVISNDPKGPIRLIKVTAEKAK